MNSGFSDPSPRPLSDGARVRGEVVLPAFLGDARFDHWRGRLLRNEDGEHRDPVLKLIFLSAHVLVSPVACIALHAVVILNGLGNRRQFTVVEFDAAGAGVVDCLLGIACSAKNV